MSIFGSLFGKQPAANDQAVLVKLDGVGLPDHVYEECDLATIEDRLIAVIEEKIESNERSIKRIVDQYFKERTK